MELSQAYRNVSESVSSPSPVPAGAETHGKTRITANPWRKWGSDSSPIPGVTEVTTGLLGHRHGTLLSGDTWPITYSDVKCKHLYTAVHSCSLYRSMGFTVQTWVAGGRDRGGVRLENPMHVESNGTLMQCDHTWPVCCHGAKRKEKKS